MMSFRRSFIATALALAFTPLVLAQDYPAKPVRILVPFAAGGNTDQIARITAHWLTTELKQQVIVENRPGANGAIATEAVARAAPDGYTLLMATLPQMAILPALTKSIRYDSVKDFAPVSIVARNQFALAVHADFPAKNLQEFIAKAKARPGEVMFASAGNGSVSHLASAMLGKRAGVDMTHVVYKGGALAITDVQAGHVPMYFGNVSEILPFIGAGRIRVLAVSGDRRVEHLPSVPTVAESGYPGFSAYTWNGISAPAATPTAIVNKLATLIAAGCKDANFRAQLEKAGVEPECIGPAESAKRLKSDIVVWGDTVKSSGATLD
jgi:tripartite-type tricarboxylate transporter receptor subunit TctC